MDFLLATTRQAALTPPLRKPIQLPWVVNPMRSVRKLRWHASRVFPPPLVTTGSNNLSYLSIALQARHSSDQSGAFVDHIVVTAQAGNGGPGCASFATAPNQNIAPPDGGNGGDGGSVWLEASVRCTSLKMSSRTLKAEDGHAGRGDKRRGRRGADLIAHVPPGTVVRERTDWFADMDGLQEEAEVVRPDDMVVCELNEDGQRALAARGGTGGRGNAALKSSRNRSPTLFDAGESGQKRRLELELKTIADIGLVGLPNAGKSTFLRAVSSAKPRVASYPFTTLRPHIGVVKAITTADESLHRTMTVADIPGLIEGAHDNRGLGHDFLRHIERTAFLIYVLDVSVAGAADSLRVLRRELEMHDEGLSRRQCCIVANKMDMGDAGQELGSLLDAVGDSVNVFPVSAKHGTGVDSVVRHLAARVT